MNDTQHIFAHLARAQLEPGSASQLQSICSQTYLNDE